MNLVITLPLRNQHELDQFLKDVYDPANANYHQFLTVDQFTEQFGPTQAQYDAVVNFAHANGLTVGPTSPNRLTVQVSGTAANVEAAFHVTLGLYQHPTESRTFYGPDREPTTGLSFSLWHVSGLDDFSLPHPAGLSKNPLGAAAKSNATTGSGPSASFLGSDMRAAYYGGSLTGSGQSVGLLEYYGTDLADLTTYFKNAGQTNNVPVTLIDRRNQHHLCFSQLRRHRANAGHDEAPGMAPGLSSLVVYGRVQPMRPSLMRWRRLSPLTRN